MIRIIIFLLGSSCLIAQSRNNDDQAEVKQVVLKNFEALDALDIELIKQCSTKDLIVLEAGTIWNLDTIANRIGKLKSLNASRTDHITFIATEVTGNTAWVAYYNSVDVVINSTLKTRKWLESVFLVKEGTSWKIRLLHSTAVPKTE